MSRLSTSLPALLRTGMAPLPVLGLLKAHGPEAEAFLQAQLTNDVAGLEPGSARLAGYCSVKGRLTASFWVWRDAAEPTVYWLACSRDIAAAVAKRLAMFVLRAKVRVEDVSEAFALVGLVAADGEPLPTAGPASAAATVQPVMLPEVVIGAGPADALGQAGFFPGARDRFVRGLVALPAADLEAVLAQAGGDAIGQEDWLRLEVLSGVPRIDGGNQDLFVPQMVNFELVGGVSFRKGCYPGQEVVARTQYLGKLKRRMYLGVGEGAPPASGADVSTDSSGSVEPVGQVVLAAALPGADRYLVLFEARIDAAGAPWEAPGDAGRAAAALSIGESRLTQLPLPYPVPAPAPASRPQR